jgi:two-component system phosphate regulon response regulator PhoB
MTQRPKILVIEDEKDVQDLMLLHLKREGFDTVQTENGEEALRLLENSTYDLVIVDWMLPGLSGLEICKRVNQKYPTLMVTARADTSDIVLGLELGADDYLTKPFEIPIFLARVRALLRRKSTTNEKPITTGMIEIGQLKLDLDAYRVMGGNEEIQLTPYEFKLLTALMRNPGKVLSRDRLIELVQGQGVAVVDRAIDTHVFGLRKKLGPYADLIETIRGIGYRVISP